MTAVDQVLDQIDDAIADWEISPDAVRFNAPEEARLQRPPWVLPDWVWEAVSAQLRDILEAAADGYLRRWVRVHNLGRCSACHPMANPPRLPIDGAEYSRRQRARRRT